MTTAPKGYYRQLLESSYPMVRIAFTHTPMYNVTRVDSANVLSVFDNSDDPYAKYYANGIRTGAMVAIVENPQVNTYYKVGELYFKS